MSARSSSEPEITHLSEALYDAFSLRASQNFLGLRTGATVHDPITQVPKSVFEFKSFQQVRDDALGAATCMALDLKMQRRQFFGICCGNCYDWLLFEFASCFNDLPLVGMNTKWKPDVLAYIINLSKIVCIACSADIVPVFQHLKPSCPSLQYLIVINCDPLKPLLPCPPENLLTVFVWDTSSRRVRLHHSPPPSQLSQPIPAIDCRDDTVLTLTCVGMPDFTLRKLRGQLPELHQDDIHSLLFTSGTSGVPKGVVVTKNRWYLDNKDGGVMKDHCDPAFLAYNSFAHGADRGSIWMSLFTGARVGIGRELGEDCSHHELLCDFAGIEPSCYFAFSYLWSELHAAFNRELEVNTISHAFHMIENQTPAIFEGQGLLKHHDLLSDVQVALLQRTFSPQLALSVISLTASLESSNIAPEVVPALQQLQQSKRAFVNSAAKITGSRDLLIAKWCQRMGGNLLKGSALAVVTGGGHTSEEVLSWMQEVFGGKSSLYKDNDCIWKNAYGSSEFPGISLNGAISDAIDLELVPIYDDEGKCVCNPDDPSNKTGRGEIRVRHKDASLRVQYYCDPEATAAAVKDGWYYTGDVGEWDLKGKLVIVDRVKNLCELYVDGDSKWVDPSRLELELYADAPCVKQICLVSDRNKPQMIALLVPSDAELQCRRFIGDRTLADETLECDAEFTSSLFQQLNSFAHTQRRPLTFELPCAVVVCAQPWTVANGLLTANGKLKRGDLKKRFQSDIERAYASCSCQSTSQVSSQAGLYPKQNSEVALHFPCSIATVVVPCYVFGRDCVTHVENCRFHMRDEIPFRVNDTVKFAGESLPAGISCDKVYVVASKSLVNPHFFEICESISSKLFQVAVSDTATTFTVHQAVLLPEPLSSCLQQLAQLTGVGFIQSKLPAEAIGMGRIKNDLSTLPFLEGSVTKRDFIKFEFKGADGSTTASSNELLSRLKAIVQTFRDSAESWFEQINKIRLDADNAEADQIKAINDDVDAKFFKFMWSNEDATAGAGFADDNHSFLDDLETLLICLTARIQKINVLREHTKAIKSQELPAKQELLRKYNVELDTLRVLAPRFGLSIPDEIHRSNWLTASSSSTTRGMDWSIGDTMSYCCVTGTIIQKNLIGAGKPRYNNTDDGTKQCSIGGHTLVHSVISVVKNLSIAHHELAERMWATLRRCSLFSPFLPESSAARAWCLEYNTSKSLLASCFRSPTLDKTDSPAGRLFRAFCAFANRPALGIPDAKEMQAHELLSSIHFRRSAFADALGIELTLNRGYRWISYADLGRMASYVAKSLRAMGIPRGSFVAISGYNDIEWAACDFACALSGLVSVGIHSTFNAEEALFALHNCSCVALLTCAEFVLDDDHRGIDKPFWSVQSVFTLAKKKNQLAIFKLSQVFLIDAVSTMSTADFAEMSPPVRIHSMVDMLCAPFKYHNISIEHPDLQPEGGLDANFTILHTGGSSGGAPKQVIVKARGFARDISARNFKTPLVTCSYIPLSHSSDRFKLWEFCCCGGSVAFAFYKATHWLDHERLKKSEALDAGPLDGADFNNVDSLLRQLQDVAVTDMACPPNIWAAVYRMYKQFVKTPGVTEQQACERIRRLFGNRLKNIATGGAPTPPDVMSAIPMWFPHATVVDSFAATECGAISANGKVLSGKGVQIKVRQADGALWSYALIGELLVSSPSMSAGYLNDAIRTNESFIELSFEHDNIFPPVSKQDALLKWYATGDLVEVAFRWLGGNWVPENIKVKGRMSAEVKLSSGSAVSPDVLEPIYANSPLFSDIYIDSRRGSTACVAIVIPARSHPVIRSKISCSSDREYCKQRSQFIDAAIKELRSIGDLHGLPHHHIPRNLHVDMDAWSVQNRMLNSNLKKNRKMFREKYELILQSLHAPFLTDAAISLPVEAADKSPQTQDVLKFRASHGDSWAVLCTGGNIKSHYGSLDKPWKTLDKSHLGPVNRMFQSLSKLLGPDRIIVIGTFKTHHKFLQDAAQSGFPPHYKNPDPEASKVKWQQELKVYEDEFCDILKHCDYDGEHVNPSTIIDVISGRQVHFPTPVAGRVIPYSQGVRSVFFYIHSHGWSYAIPQRHPTVCDLCVAMGNTDLMLPENHPNVGHAHSSLATRDWYISMPHPGDPRDFQSVVFPAGPQPCLDPFDKRLRSFVTDVASGSFKWSEDETGGSKTYSYPPLFVPKNFAPSWDKPEVSNEYMFDSYFHDTGSLPVFINVRTRETARHRPDVAQHATSRLPEGWVEYLYYQNGEKTISRWVLNPATSNCPLREFLYDRETTHSRFILHTSLWQHFFTGFEEAIQQSPFTNFVAMFDACGSGGFAKFLNDPAFEKHAQVSSWKLAVIAASNEQISASPIFHKFCEYLEQALLPNPPQPDDAITTNVSLSQVTQKPSIHLRDFFTAVLDHTRVRQERPDDPQAFASQGVNLASGSGSGIEGVELKSIFYNNPRS